MEDMTKLLSKLSDRIDKLSSDMEEIKNPPSRSRSPLRKTTTSSSSWAERDEDEEMDFDKPIDWDEDGSVEVSDGTKKLLESVCTQSVPNSSRIGILKSFGKPKVPQTKTPRLDDYLKEEVSKKCKQLDKELAKVHTFMLDAMAPLIQLRDLDWESASGEDVSMCVDGAIRLLGNASSRMATLRRESVLTDVNRSLLPLASSDELFANAPPNLFGADFAKQSKERVDQVKAIRSLKPSSASQSNKDHQPSQRFFRTGFNHSRGRNFSHGRTRGSFSHRGARAESRQFASTSEAKFKK